MTVVHSGWQDAIRPLARDEVLIAIGDVHGRADLLADLHCALETELAQLAPRTATCVHLGDLIDRGPRNRDVLLRVRRGLRHARTRTLLGNHEARLLRLLGEDDRKSLDRWLAHGGDSLFAEFSLDPDGDWRTPLRAALGPDLLGWLEGAPVMLRIGPYLLVHAGLDTSRPLDDQSERALTTIRQPWLSSDGPYEEAVAVLHGHTPVDRVDLAHGHRINLDTGACMTGVLSALLVCGDRMKVLSTRRP